MHTHARPDNILALDNPVTSDLKINACSGSAMKNIGQVGCW